MSGPVQPRCSVVIPTHVRAASLRGVLDSLRAQTMREFEAIVVVDGEDAATRELSSRYEAGFPLRWEFLPESKGQANARNRGAELARAPYLAFLDDDTIPAPQWLECHVLGHVADGDWVRVVRGRTCHCFERPAGVIERYLRKERDEIERTFGNRGGSDISIRECCVGVNCSLSRGAFLAAGGFDGNLRQMDEDMELGTRMFLRGARFVYEPAAVVEHRDTKILADYHLRCWRGAADTDIYRLTRKGERTEQLSAVTRLRNGSRLRRAKERFVWERPQQARRIAERIRSVAETSGSHIAAWLWRSLMSSTEYWDEVRKTGLDADLLQQATGWPVVTLAFHSIGPLQAGDDWKYCIESQKFHHMVDWLTHHGYGCIPVGGTPSAEHNFELTFDDGYEDFYTQVFPHVERCKLQPLVFIVTGEIGGWNTWDDPRARRQRLLSAEQMSEMHRFGVQFGSHTVSHPDLTQVSDSELRHEVRDSKSRLEDLLGGAVNAFAYPYGCVDERVRAAVGEAGYTRAYTTYPGRNWFGDPLLLKRAEIGEADSMATFAHKVKHGASARERIAQHMPRRAKRVLQMLL